MRTRTPELEASIARGNLLIGAAPDMLAALRYCNSAINAACRADDFTGDYLADIIDAGLEARAAIAKAEGK